MELTHQSSGSDTMIVTVSDTPMRSPPSEGFDGGEDVDDDGADVVGTAPSVVDVDDCDVNGGAFSAGDVVVGESSLAAGAPVGSPSGVTDDRSFDSVPQLVPASRSITIAAPADLLVRSTTQTVLNE